jgi:hypothetical protein
MMKNLLIIAITVGTLTFSVQAADSQASAKLPAAGKDNSIRSFQVNVPEEQLTNLRKRIVETRWPEKETVTDASQAFQLRGPGGIPSFAAVGSTATDSNIALNRNGKER